MDNDALLLEKRGKDLLLIPMDKDSFPNSAPFQIAMLKKCVLKNIYISKGSFAGG